MCNRRLASLCQSSLHSDNSPNNQQHYQVVPLMDGPLSNSSSRPGSQSTHNSNDEAPRVKLLCSFGGTILPRPQDGKLRHVGGETRIVSLPREISYDELMSRMRELFEGASVLKYQQPDEDLDALVSVVNDDDVMNMMEEYDKLGSGDGFTRLRIFLFSHPDQDGSSHYVDGNERESEKRYVDALNNMNDPLDFWRQSESPLIREMDDMHLAEHFFGSMSLEGGLHSQRNSEMHMPHMNLHQLTIPRLGSGQYQQPISQRYGEMEGPWSPAYYSPRHYGHHDPRAEFPPSPSSARYGMGVGELPDKCFDRIPDESAWSQMNHQPVYENHQQFRENVVWMPASGALPGDKAGFPGNIMHGPNVLDGNNFCDHCYIGIPRSQSNLDQHAIGNNLPQINNPRHECPASGENCILNGNSKLHHGVYPREQTDPRIGYSEPHSQERGWILQHQLNPRPEDARVHINGSARVNEHYVADASSVNLSVGHNNFVDGHHASMNFVRQHGGPELGGEAFHDQSSAIHAHPTLPEEHSARYGNLSYAYGPDHLHPPLGHAQPQVLWRNIPNAMHAVPTYEASYSPQPINGMMNSGLPRAMPEGSPRLRIGGDNQNAWVETSQKVLGIDGTNTGEYPMAMKASSSNYVQDTRNLPIHDAIQPPQIPSTYIPEQVNEIGVSEVVGMKNVMTNRVQEEVNKVNTPTKSIVEPDKIVNTNFEEVSGETCPTNCLTSVVRSSESTKMGNAERGSTKKAVVADDIPGFIPDVHHTSIEKTATEVAEHVKSKAEENAHSASQDVIAKDANCNDAESNTQGKSHMDSDNDNVNNSKIEPTKAEAEAIARGLQTIRNDDLEEVRELGSGTYGAVYHGKWKGSDVAIKRIKASCFAGRPSERERLIADFWKEALILSSLHHPNVVSFYGIVRDGPDGSLATVTEFMINGSLKQFLQKKDRTIDRRKRLIIAMDAAFGMEYLHGKNIVHFDLKCENLLVNMRDPQRPVCKIGDLGLSKVKQHTLVSGGVRGTLPWMAPELLSGKSNMVTEKIDVYSFGIVMWELLTGDEPYSDMHCASIIGGIVNNTLRPQIPTWCDPEWKSLMESCWTSDPSERPSFSEISQKLRSMAAAMNMK